MKPSLDEALARILEREGWDSAWWDAMDERVKRDFTKLAAGIVFDLLSSVRECESPIEVLLGLHLHVFDLLIPFMGETSFVIDTQHPIEAPGGPFRVDFIVTGQSDWTGKSTTLLVECDGHDYHERTKEQAERDKRRDRALKRARYDVIHFTGREIWRDPRKCAREIRDQFRALAECGDREPREASHA